MVIERPPYFNHPSGRVPKQELLLIPISVSQRRQNSMVFCVTGHSLRLFGRRCKYRPKGGTEGGPTRPGGQRVRPPPPGRAMGPPGWMVALLQLPFALLEPSD